MEIEIFSDVVCPWCFIGKRRLDRALAAPGGSDEAPLQGEVSLRWRPYQLYPNLPAQGVDRGEYLRRRYGEQADAGKIPQRIRQEAEAEGITLRFDRIRRTPNTLLAHQLLEFAYSAGLQHELSEALFLAYFCEGVDVGDRDALLEVAAAVGLDAGAAAEYLQQGTAVEEVRSQLTRAPEIGVSGVPGYYIANGFLLPGAQTSETMGQIIRRVRDRLQ